MSAESDRNLLFLLLALQNGYINTKHFRKSTAIWMKEPTREIGGILVDIEILLETEHQRIQGLVDDRIRRLGGLDASLDFTLQTTSMPDPECLPKDWQERIDIQTKTLAKRGDNSSSKRGPWAPTTGLARYEIGTVLGIGGQGIVFEAVDRELKRRVALKRVKPELLSDREMAQCLIEEAQLASRFDHGGIAPVYDIGADEEGNPFFVMQLIRGEKLSDKTGSINYKSNSKEQFIIEIRPLVRRIIDVCNTLQYAYDKFGIIHQDLKPQNIMVDRYGETIVVDWGMGRKVQLVEGASIQLPISSNLDSNGNERGGAGTPGYLSPEQAQSISNLDHRTDIWGIGATLYKIATGQTANRGANRLELLENARKNLYLRPTVVNPLIPKELEAICLKAMASQPENRYQNASYLASDLESWIAGDPVSALSEGHVKKAERFLRRHSRTVITSMLIMGLGLAGLLGAYLSVKTAWRQTLESRELVTRVLDKIVGDTIDDDLSQKPDADGIRIDLLTKAASEIAQFVKEFPEDDNLKLDYLYILIRLGHVQDPTAASVTWRKAEELVTSYESRQPRNQNNEQWVHAIIDMRRYFFDDLIAIKEFELARGQNEKARYLVDRLYQKNPSEPSFATAFAFVHLQRITIWQADNESELNKKVEEEFNVIERALIRFYNDISDSNQVLIENTTAHGTVLSYISMLIMKAEWYNSQNKDTDCDEACAKILKASQIATRLPKAGFDICQFQMRACIMLLRSCTNKKDLKNAKIYLDQALKHSLSGCTIENDLTQLFPLCLDYVRAFAEVNKDSCIDAINKEKLILQNEKLVLEENQRLELEYCLVLAQLALAKAAGDPIDIDNTEKRAAELRADLHKQVPKSPLLDE
jgi:serine/threonine protein kinase